jgi:hypothetical protein
MQLVAVTVFKILRQPAMPPVAGDWPKSILCGLLRYATTWRENPAAI